MAARATYRARPDVAVDGMTKADRAAVPEDRQVGLGVGEAERIVCFPTDDLPHHGRAGFDIDAGAQRILDQVEGFGIPFERHAPVFLASAQVHPNASLEIGRHRERIHLGPVPRILRSRHPIHVERFFPGMPSSARQVAHQSLPEDALGHLDGDAACVAGRAGRHLFQRRGPRVRHRADDHRVPVFTLFQHRRSSGTPILARAEQRPIEGHAVHQFRQEQHGWQVGIVFAHAVHREGDDRDVREPRHEAFDLRADFLIDPDQALTRGLDARQIAEVMVGIDAVIEQFDRVVGLSEPEHGHVPIRGAFGEQPFCDVGALLHRSAQHRAHARRQFDAGIDHDVQGIHVRGLAEPRRDFAHESRGHGLRMYPKVVSSPSHDADGVRHGLKIEIGHVEDHAFRVDVRQEGAFRGIALSYAERVGIERDHGPLAGCLGLAPRREVFPGQPGVTRFPLGTML